MTCNEWTSTYQREYKQDESLKEQDKKIRKIIKVNYFKIASRSIFN